MDFRSSASAEPPSAEAAAFLLQLTEEWLQKGRQDLVISMAEVPQQTYGVLRERGWTLCVNEDQVLLRGPNITASSDTPSVSAFCKNALNSEKAAKIVAEGEIDGEVLFGFPTNEALQESLAKAGIPWGTALKLAKYVFTQSAKVPDISPDSVERKEPSREIASHISDTTVVGGKITGVHQDHRIINKHKHVYAAVERVFPKSPSMNLQEAERRFGLWVKQCHSKMRMPGLPGGEDSAPHLLVNLSALYVSLRMVQTCKGSGFSRDDILRNPWMATGTSSSEEMHLRDALNLSRFLVVIGGPGSGKSITLQWLVSQHAQALCAGLNSVLVDEPLVDASKESTSSTSVDFGRTLFPILIRVRDWVPPRGNIPDLLDYLSHFVWNQLSTAKDLGSSDESTHSSRPADVGVSAEMLRAMIEKHLDQGTMLLCVDGLDEVNRMREVIDRLELFFQLRMEGTGSVLVVSSRPAGYKANPVAHDSAREVEILPMSVAVIKRFCHRWVDSVAPIHFGQLPFDVIEGIKSKLIGAVLENPKVTQLATIPLMVTVMAMMVVFEVKPDPESSSWLPPQRCRLYDRALCYLAKVWRTASEFTDEKLLNVMQNVAWEIHQNWSSSTLPLDELRKLLNGEQEVASVEDLLSEMQGKVGLLATQGEDIDGKPMFGFLHRQFQEFFVGRSLVERGVGVIVEKMASPLYWQSLLLGLGWASWKMKEDAFAGLLADLVHVDERAKLPKGGLLVAAALPEMTNLPSSHVLSSLTNCLIRALSNAPNGTILQQSLDRGLVQIFEANPDAFSMAMEGIVTYSLDQEVTELCNLLERVALPTYLAENVVFLCLKKGLNYVNPSVRKLLHGLTGASISYRLCDLFPLRIWEPALVASLRKRCESLSIVISQVGGVVEMGISSIMLQFRSHLEFLTKSRYRDEKLFDQYQQLQKLLDVPLEFSPLHIARSPCMLCTGGDARFMSTYAFSRSTNCKSFRCAVTESCLKKALVLSTEHLQEQIDLQASLRDAVSHSVKILLGLVNDENVALGLLRLNLIYCGIPQWDDKGEVKISERMLAEEFGFILSGAFAIGKCDPEKAATTFCDKLKALDDLFVLRAFRLRHRIHNCPQVPSSTAFSIHQEMFPFFLDDNVEALVLDAIDHSSSLHWSLSEVCDYLMDIGCRVALRVSSGFARSVKTLVDFYRGVESKEKNLDPRVAARLAFGGIPNLEDQLRLILEIIESVDRFVLLERLYCVSQNMDLLTPMHVACGEISSVRNRAIALKRLFVLGWARQQGELLHCLDEVTDVTERKLLRIELGLEEIAHPPFVFFPIGVSQHFESPTTAMICAWAVCVVAERAASIATTIESSAPSAILDTNISSLQSVKEFVGSTANGRAVALHWMSKSEGKEWRKMMGAILLAEAGFLSSAVGKSLVMALDSEWDFLRDRARLFLYRRKNVQKASRFGAFFIEAVAEASGAASEVACIAVSWMFQNLKWDKDDTAMISLWTNEIASLARDETTHLPRLQVLHRCLRNVQLGDRNIRSFMESLIGGTDDVCRTGAISSLRSGVIESRMFYSEVLPRLSRSEIHSVLRSLSVARSKTPYELAQEVLEEYMRSPAKETKAFSAFCLALLFSTNVGHVAEAFEKANGSVNIIFDHTIPTLLRGALSSLRVPETLAAVIIVIVCEQLLQPEHISVPAMDARISALNIDYDHWVHVLCLVAGSSFFMGKMMDACAKTLGHYCRRHTDIALIAARELDSLLSLRLTDSTPDLHDIGAISKRSALLSVLGEVGRSGSLPEKVSKALHVNLIAQAVMYHDSVSGRAGAVVLLAALERDLSPLTTESILYGLKGSYREQLYALEACNVIQLGEHCLEKVIDLIQVHLRSASALTCYGAMLLIRALAKSPGVERLAQQRCIELLQDAVKVFSFPQCLVVFESNPTDDFDMSRIISRGSLETICVDLLVDAGLPTDDLALVSHNVSLEPVALTLSDSQYHITWKKFFSLPRHLMGSRTGQMLERRYHQFGVKEISQKKILSLMGILSERLYESGQNTDVLRADVLRDMLLGWLLKSSNIPVGGDPLWALCQVHEDKWRDFIDSMRDSNNYHPVCLYAAAIVFHARIFLITELPEKFICALGPTDGVRCVLSVRSVKDQLIYQDLEQVEQKGTLGDRLKAWLRASNTEELKRVFSAFPDACATSLAEILKNSNAQTFDSVCSNALLVPSVLVKLVSLDKRLYDEILTRKSPSWLCSLFLAVNELTKALQLKDEYQLRWDNIDLALLVADNHSATAFALLKDHNIPIGKFRIDHVLKSAQSSLARVLLPYVKECTHLDAKDVIRCVVPDVALAVCARGLTLSKVSLADLVIQDPNLLYLREYQHFGWKISVHDGECLVHRIKGDVLRLILSAPEAKALFKWDYALFALFKGNTLFFDIASEHLEFSERALCPFLTRLRRALERGDDGVLFLQSLGRVLKTCSTPFVANLVVTICNAIVASVEDVSSAWLLEYVQLGKAMSDVGRLEFSIESAVLALKIKESENLESVESLEWENRCFSLALYPRVITILDTQNLAKPLAWFSECAKGLEKARRFGRSSWRLNYLYGRLLMVIEEYEDAFSSLSSADCSTPNFKHSEWRALCNLRRGDLHSACFDYCKVYVVSGNYDSPLLKEVEMAVASIPHLKLFCDASRKLKGLADNAYGGDLVEHAVQAREMFKQCSSMAPEWHGGLLGHFLTFCSNSLLRDAEERCIFESEVLQVYHNLLLRVPKYGLLACLIAESAYFMRRFANPLELLTNSLVVLRDAADSSRSLGGSVETVEFSPLLSREQILRTLWFRAIRYAGEEKLEEAIRDAEEAILLQTGRELKLLGLVCHRFSLKQFVESVGAILGVLGIRPTFVDRPCLDFFEPTAFLPALLRRADKLVHLLLGYGIDISCAETDGSVLGICVSFERSTDSVDALRILSVLQVVLDLVRDVDGDDFIFLKIKLDELKYD